MKLLDLGCKDDQGEKWIDGGERHNVLKKNKHDSYAGLSPCSGTLCDANGVSRQIRREPVLSRVS